MSAVYEIGKFYRVPVVFGVVYSYAPRWLPALGPKHEDAAIIGFRDQHYHIDWRFAPEALLKLGSRFGSPLGIVLHEGRANPDGLGRPELRRIKCKRLMPEFPRHRAGWVERLERAHSACKLKPGMVCPHRGIPLDTLPVVNDVVTCPGHGLRWHVRAGELVTA